MNYLSISGVLTFIFCLFSALFVFFNGEKKEQNVVWAFCSLLISLWGFGLFWAFYLSDFESVLFWSRFLNLVAIFIPITFLHFVFSFIGKNGLFKKVIRLGYLVTISYFFISLLFPSYFVKTVVKKAWFNLYPEPGLVYYFFPLLFSICVITGVFYLFLEFRKDSGTRKNQLLYLFIAMGIGLTGGGTTFFPVFNIPIYPFGANGLMFLVIIIAYAITKHELMDIKVLIARKDSKFITGILKVLTFLSLLLLSNINVAVLVCLGLVLFWHIFESWIQLKIQTPLDKKFLKGKYNIETILSNLSRKLVASGERTQVIMELAEEFAKSMELRFVYALIPESKNKNKETQFLLLSMKWSKNRNDTLRPGYQSVFEKSHSIVTLALETKLPHILSNSVIIEVQDEKSIDIPKGSLVVPIRSSIDHFQGALILGPKLNEEIYSDRDINLLNLMITQLTVVFDRIAQQEKLNDAYQNLDMAYGNLEFKNKEEERLNQKLSESIIQLQSANAKIQMMQDHYKQLAEENEQSKDVAIIKAKELSHRAALAGLTMGISHEIRNPLVGVVNGSEAMRNKFLGYEGSDQHPWTTVISPHTFISVAPIPEEQEAIFNWLKASGYLTDHDEPNLELPDINPFYGPLSFDLPEPLTPYSEKVTELFQEQYKKTMVIQYLDMTEKSCRRVIRIAGDMMQYGANKGVHKDLFLRIKGFTDSQAEELFHELVQKHYFDAYGGTLERFLPNDPEFKLDLSGRFKPYEEAILHLISTVSNIPKTKVDLTITLNDSIRMIQSAFIDKSIQYVQNFQHTQTVLGDSTRLFQVFNILMTNAIEAMFDNTEDTLRVLTIKTEDMQFYTFSHQYVNGVMVSIQDTGCGISPENLEKLRNPFFSTKGPTGGKNAGLGLSILYEVVEKHGGRVEVESQEKGGTTFKIYIPSDFGS